MIKGRGCPRRGAVAQSAIGRESRADVIRIGGAGEILGVARIAIGRNGREVVIHVARGTGHGNVRAGQREDGLVMVEDCAAPVRGGVTNLAIGREAG